MTQRVILATIALVTASSASAQVVGTFSWQTQPFCNRVTLTVVHVGGIYQLNGVDDNAVAKRSP
jgi:hypothetical protein